MYNNDGPLRISVEIWVMNRLHYFSTKYIATKAKNSVLVQNGPF
jgi:hypothetical protein